MARDVLGPVADYPPGGVEQGSVESLLDLFTGKRAQHPARPLLTPKEGSALIRRISGAPERKPVMLLRPGRKHARPCPLVPGLVGLPAFERVIDRAA